MVRASQILVLVAIALLVILIGPSGPTLTEISAYSTTLGAVPQPACGDGIARAESQPADADRVLTLYRAEGLDLNAVQDMARQMSRLLLHQLPYNVDAAEIPNRKAMFIAASQLGAERSFILAARDCLRAGVSLSSDTQARLDRLDARYGGDGSISELLARVNGYVVQVQYLIQEHNRLGPVDAAGITDPDSKSRPELAAAVARAAP